MTDSMIEQIDKTEAQELAAQIKANGTWQLDLGHDSPEYKLCSLAGLGGEFDASDGDNFEAVIFKAADKFGVDII